MQFASTVFASLLAAAAVAAPIEQTPEIVNFTVQKNSTSHPSVSKASSPVNVLQNDRYNYLVDVTMGTPGQTMQIYVDTGASDTWIKANDYQGNGGFKSDKSSTFSEPSGPVYRVYDDDGNPQSYSYTAKDKFAIGDIELNDVQFGISFMVSDNRTGVLGLGYKASEIISPKYDNFLVEMKKQGKINKEAFSLYMNSADANSGSLLFGAIDHAKYSGNLDLLDVVLIDRFGAAVKEPQSFSVPLKGVSQGKKSISNKMYPALLDSGKNLLYAPGDIVKQIAKKLGAHHIPLTDKYVGSCNPDVEDIEFNFGDTTIKVPAKNFMRKDHGKESKMPGCVAAIKSSPADYYILGDAFFSSAYVYFDLEANKIGIAQAKYTKDSKIEIL